VFARSIQCALWSALVLALAAPAHAQAETPRFEFDWPVPGTVKVREKADKRGADVEMTYTAKLERHPNGEDLVLALTDWKFVKFMGRDATDPALVEGLKAATAISSAIPKLNLKPSGEMIGIEDLSELLDRLLAMFEQEGADQEVVDMMRRTFADPNAREMMEQSGSQYWAVWVAAWIVDHPPAAGETKTYTIFRPRPGQTPVPGGYTLTNHGPAPGHPGHLRLTIEEVIDGPNAKTLLRGQINAILSQLARQRGGEDELRDALDKLEAKITMRNEVITDPATMKPVYARAERSYELTVAGQPQNGNEVKEYWFDWD